MASDTINALPRIHCGSCTAEIPAEDVRDVLAAGRAELARELRSLLSRTGYAHSDTIRLALAELEREQQPAGSDYMTLDRAPCPGPSCAQHGTAHAHVTGPDLDTARLERSNRARRGKRKGARR